MPDKLPLTLIETRCWDGSVLRRFTPLDPDLVALLQLVATALDDLVQAVAPADQPHRLLDTAYLSPERSLPDPLLCWAGPAGWHRCATVQNGDVPGHSTAPSRPQLISTPGASAIRQTHSPQR
jgi:hypothetical protein